MTEMEKIQYLNAKYGKSKRLYTVYSREEALGRYVFTLIYGTDKKRKVLSYIQKKEALGLFLIVYCTNPRAGYSRCVFVTGMANTLTTSTASDAACSPVVLAEPAAAVQG